MLTLFRKRMFMTVAFIAIGVMVGLNMASSGIERIQGPNQLQGQAPAWTVQTSGQGQAQQGQVLQQQGQVPYVGQPATVTGQQVYVQQPALQQPAGGIDPNLQQPIIPRSVKEPTVDRIASKTGGMLESLSQKGIRFVVSLFSSITD